MKNFFYANIVRRLTMLYKIVDTKINKFIIVTSTTRMATKKVFVKSKRHKEIKPLKDANRT